MSDDPLRALLGAIARRASDAEEIAYRGPHALEEPLADVPQLVDGLRSVLAYCDEASRHDRLVIAVASVRAAIAAALTPRETPHG